MREGEGGTPRGLAATVRSTVRWVLAPATGDAGRLPAAGLTAVRILVGLMWLYNVDWKRAPDFGRDSGDGLWAFTSLAVSDPIFPPFSWLVENLVLPAFPLAGWGVLIAETALAVLLLSGAWVRVAALLGIVQSLAIGLSVAAAPHEWPWSYWLMIGVHVALLVGPSGRVLAVDAVRARLADGRILARVWGALAVLAGLWGVIASIADPLAARGARLGSTEISISLGSVNVLGGVVLVAVGVLLVVAASGPALASSLRRAIAVVAAAVAVLAAASLHAQRGFSDPLLGGGPTTAALLLTLALAAGAVGLVAGRPPERPIADPRRGTSRPSPEEAPR